MADVVIEDVVLNVLWVVLSWGVGSFLATLTFWGWWQVLDAVRDRVEARARDRRESVAR